MDTEKLGQELLKEFVDLGNSLKAELWNDQNKQFLAFIATDIAGLTAKMLATNDAAKRQKYERAINVLKHHVAVMAFSRLNVIEKQTSETVLRVLEKAVGFIVKAALGAVGVTIL